MSNNLTMPVAAAVDGTPPVRHLSTAGKHSFGTILFTFPHNMRYSYI